MNTRPNSELTRSWNHLDKTPGRLGCSSTQWKNWPAWLKYPGCSAPFFLCCAAPVCVDSESYPSTEACLLLVFDRFFITRCSARWLYARRVSFSFVGLGLPLKKFISFRPVVSLFFFFGLLLCGSSVDNRPMSPMIWVPGVAEASLSWPGVKGDSAPELNSLHTLAGVRGCHLSFCMCAGMELSGLESKRIRSFCGSRRCGRSGVLKAAKALLVGVSRTECGPV